MSAVVDEIALAPSTDVEVVVNYLKNPGRRTMNYEVPPPGVPKTVFEIDPRTIKIQDARRVDGLGFTISGFELIPYRSMLTDWDSYQDAERVKAIEYPIAEAIFKARTGAEKVVIFEHAVRESIAAPGPNVRKPVHFTHCDQSFLAARNRVSRHLPPEEAAQRLQGRLAVVNLWRPIGGPVLREPLAVCDARTIEANDLIPTDLMYPDSWVEEWYVFAANPRHRWYWYPRQTVNEAILLKICDSTTAGSARLTAHTAFNDPTTPADAPPRRSIEMRALCFW